MKKFLALATAASVVALAAGADATTSTWNLTLKGVVAPFITIDTVTAGCTSNCQEVVSGNNRTIAISNFTTDGVTNEFSNTSDIKFLSNSAFTATLTATAGALLNTTDNTFSVPYTARLVGGTNDLSNLEVDAATLVSPGQSSDFGYNASGQTVSVVYKVAANNSAALAGTYQDKMVLKVVTK